MRRLAAALSILLCFASLAAAQPSSGPGANKYILKPNSARLRERGAFSSTTGEKFAPFNYNALCTANGVPFSCCTGSLAGSCLSQIDTDGTEILPFGVKSYRSSNGNFIKVFDNNGLVTAPTCTTQGTAGMATLLDIDNTSAQHWVLCAGTTQTHDLSFDDKRYNILAFGATPATCTTFGTACTGVSSRTAIQNTIFAACATGGTVYIPAGFYLLTSADCQQPDTGSCPGGNAWYLQIPCDNITIEGDGTGASFLVGTQTSQSFGATVLGPHIFFIQGGCKPAWTALGAVGVGCENATTQWDNNHYLFATTRTMSVATSGDAQVTLATPAEASNFAVDNLVYIYTGQTINHPNNQNPDAEVNRVVSSNPGTGVVTLAWPLSAGYRQERQCQASDCLAAGYPCGCCTGAGTISATAPCPNTGNTTIANTACTGPRRPDPCCTGAGTGCASGATWPFAIANVTDRTLHSIQLHDLSLWNYADASGGYLINAAQVAQLAVERIEGRARRSGIVGERWRDIRVEDNTIIIDGATAATQYTVAAATGTVDMWIVNNDISATSASRQLHSHEGVKGLYIIGNSITGTVDGFNELISTAGRAYHHTVQGNRFRTNTLTGGRMIGWCDQCDGDLLLDGNTFIRPPTSTTRIIDKTGNGVHLGNNVLIGGAGTAYNGSGQLAATPTTISASVTAAEVTANAYSQNIGQLTYLGNLPTGVLVTEVGLNLITVFNASGTDLLSVGTDTNNTAITASNDVSANLGFRVINSVNATTGTPPLEAGSSAITLPFFNTVERELYVRYANGGSEPTTGSAYVWITYVPITEPQ